MPGKWYVPRQDDFDMDVKVLRAKLARYGQEHLLQFWTQLTSEQKKYLYAELCGIDFAEVTESFRRCTEIVNNEKLDNLLQPIPSDSHGAFSRSSPKQLQDYREEGLRQVAQGHVAALLLAGGQGTRLGVEYPKGMYDVGLPSHKTLYQLQGERLLRLERLAFKLTGMHGNIPWYIMTSEHTMEPTLEFFDANNYFGLKKNNLIVFEQDMLPCFTFSGKIIMETPWKVARAPDGNGGLFKALKQRGILDDMEKRGIKFLHVYCVDNILVKMADPVFIGYCISKGANCAAKVVEKVSPTEAVGVVCRVDGKFQVVEYSEISPDTAEKRNPDGKLTFNAGNICNHFFTLDFLENVGSGQGMKYHVAKKKISFINEEGKQVIPTKPNGLKLEKFVFDIFQFTEKFVAWEVKREDEFSPMKNSNDAKKDTPRTARLALYELHRRYIMDAGGRIAKRTDISRTPNGDCLHGNENAGEKNGIVDSHDGTLVCELSPLVTYDGEDLEELVSGKLLIPPVLMSASDEIPAADRNGNRDD